MGFFDRLFGTEPQQPEQQRRAAAPQRTDDEIAVDRYQYLLRTAPPETIEQVHAEAFSKLNDEQRDLLFRQLSENADASERPANAEPATLAQAATRAELRQPGTLTRAFGNQGQGGQGQGGQGQGGPSFGSMVGSSLLGTVAGYVIASTLMSAFLPMDSGGADASGDSGADSGGDAGSGGDFGGDFGF
ncbi:hypothetical protein E3O53_00930 [Cryobacterium sp. TMT2-18-3]|uniref:hypothetical protein n=1 Tax=unclassified Cryobacterium TaxID=2649013 RepID=UPI00106C4BE0|nr:MULTISPECIES: hypothetical protein [unclassified Cryobacterium]TFC30511.1 hypothetical protein E3O22_03820 [Cryobacterium sp. TMT2-18-2]TFC37164.1 hypothetical protein E3O18_06150 [Cryobacterium sp. TMT2-42-4]TFC68271.1 hypothetical protein E3O53_00930 [Cryobacterium sp. TMT2-18-3]